MKLRHWFAISLLAGLLLSPLACVPKNVTPATPKAAAALKADSVVVRINELQATVIEACGMGAACQPNAGLNKATADNLVKACIAARSTLRDVPDGWQATVKAAWAQAKPTFTTTNPAILSAIAAVDAVLGSL